MRMLANIAKILGKYGNLYFTGLLGTLWISAVTVFFGILLGILVALMRMSKVKVFSVISQTYLEIVRDTPALLQLYFFWLLLPKIGFDLSDTACIVVALIFSAGAYISEIIRSGIQAVDAGQWEAARSIGLSEFHVLSRIIMPQAIKNILPALCNEFVSTIKGTSLASVFFIGELMTSYKTAASATFLTIESLIIAGLIYFLLNFVLSRLVTVLERRLKSSDR